MDVKLDALGIYLFILLFISYIFEVANATDVSLAGQCHSSQIYNEVTLKGGIHAGTYKDVGGVSTMQECQKKCCEFPACDLALMLAGSCYLVGCSDQKSCVLQPAKKSNFHPSVSYVTRWNSEGVKHTVFVHDKSVPKFTCPKMTPINKVTLKGGLQAGDFTDVGKVPNLEQCYDICCQQKNCDLAFMLGQNCFSVQCKDKNLCGTMPAQPSIFNPQIAYIPARLNSPSVALPKPVAVTIPKSTIPFPSLPSNGTKEAAAHVCPNTKIFDRVTLKGGVDAGNFHDNGKVEDMKQCRRICCEMTHCHLAFLLGKNCFSVKCNSVDACRAQTAKPSTFYPQISYVRKVGSNELLKSLPVEQIKPLVPKTLKGAIPGAKNDIKDASGGLGDIRPNLTKPLNEQIANLASSQVLAVPLASQAIKSLGDKTVKDADCQKDNILHNVTLKGGKKSGEFKEVKTATTMSECIQHCCDDQTKKCNLAFMLGATCYSVECESKDLCQTTDAPPSSFNPQIAVVRKIKDADNLQGNVTTSHQELSTKPTMPVTQSSYKNNETEIDDDRQHCMHGEIIKDRSLKEGKKAGRYRLYRTIPTMEACIAKCCLNETCDVAFMEGGHCFNIGCFTKTSCTAVDKEASDVSPQIAFMQHYTDQPDIEAVGADKEDTELESKMSSDSDQQHTNEGQTTSNNSNNNACSQLEVSENVAIKPGHKTGVFKELGEMKSIDNCISSCCDRPDCDIAYLLNGRCFSVQCNDGQSCQGATRPAQDGDTVKLAYMNKIDSGEKQRDMVVVYMIVGCLAFAATAGGLIWGAFAFIKRKKLRNKMRLLDEDEERIDDMLSRPTHTRYRTPHARY